MTEYSNPEIPEGINISADHPLKEFGAMLLGVSAIVLICIVILSFLAEYLVRFIPFSVEQKLAEKVSHALNIQRQESTTPTDQQQEVELYLQSLANSLLSEKDNALPVTVHYLDDDTVNAFATLGGHIIFTRALLGKMPSENALAMVMAHEIAHIQHRDPIIAMGRGLTLGLVIASLFGSGDGVIAQSLVGHIGLMSQFKFSRDAELSADKAAIEALLNYYGHLADAQSIFATLQAEQGGREGYTLFNTHPLNAERIENITRFSQDKMKDGGHRELIEVPKTIRNIVATDSSSTGTR